MISAHPQKPRACIFHSVSEWFEDVITIRPSGEDDSAVLDACWYEKLEGVILVQVRAPSSKLNYRQFESRNRLKSGTAVTRVLGLEGF